MPFFGFRSGTFRGLTIEQAAGEMARLGFDCLELCLEAPDVRPEHLDAARCSEIRRTLDGLRIGLASVSYHGDTEPPEQRRANQERAVQITHWLGADILIFNGEKITDRSRQWDEHVARFKALSSLADAEGVTLAIEPEPLLVIGSSQDMLEMMQAVGSPRLKVNLDIGHAQITDDDLAASVRQMGSTIIHLHLEDIKDRVHRHLMFGEGNIDFCALRQALADVGYSGPYVADLFGSKEPPAELAARALREMRHLFV
jgi:sugar phosphate isomerase/epimerase